MSSQAHFATSKSLATGFAPASTDSAAPASGSWWGIVRRTFSQAFPGTRASLISDPATESSSPIAPRSEARPPRAPAPAQKPAPAPVPAENPMPDFARGYLGTVARAWQAADWTNVVLLNETLARAWRENRQVFLCGNGGSAANAIHLANDLLYGVDKQSGKGLRVTALPANGAVLTCLANDVSYEDVFAQQLTVLANRGDILICLSGSGNSPNILKALTRARELGLDSFAILGFTGGKALDLADHPIHFPVHDMQVAEDLQMMVGHMAMQCLSRQPRR